MKGNIKGWNFLKGKLSADGSTTNDTLRAEKARLEARFTEIPKIIANLQNTIRLTQGDIDWLESLNNRRRKDWEKENGGKDIEQVVYDAAKRIVDYNAQISSMNTEKSRIPAQIEAIDRQFDAMIQGESAGLSKGLTATASKQLGELAVRQELGKIEHEKAVQDVQLQAVTQQAQVAQQQAKRMSPQMKWGLIIGSVVVVLGIIGYVIYQRKQALKLPKTINPVKI